jgi:hypothetical protein
MTDTLAAEFIELVSRHLTTEGQRRTIMQACCPSVARQLKFSGSPSEFAGALWERLSAYGEMVPGRPATVALLEQLKENVGVDQRRQIDNLAYAIQFEHMRNNPNAPPPPTDDIHQQYQNTALFGLRADVSELMPVVKTVERIENDVKHHGVVLFGNGDSRMGLVSLVRDLRKFAPVIILLFMIYGISIVMLFLLFLGVYHGA